MNQAKCTTCGAGLTIKKGDKTCVCEYCQSTNIVENALALGKVEVDVTEDIKKLRSNLTTFVQQNSIDEILRVSQKLLDWIPQDFVALYFFGYAKQQQNQPRFLYDFYKEPPVFTDAEFEVVVDHIIHKSELRDKRRIVHWFESFGDDLVQQYLNIHKEREDQENNYANVPRNVFVCFSSYNKEIAERVVEELEADGNTCWISTRNLRPEDAENYWRNIENAIDNSSIFLVISSEDSMRSKDVQHEVEFAKKNNKKIVEFKIDNVPHNTLFKHIFDGNKWVKGTLDVNQSYVSLLQRIYSERFDFPLNDKNKIEIDEPYSEEIESENYQSIISRNHPSKDAVETLIESKKKTAENINELNESRFEPKKTTISSVKKITAILFGTLITIFVSIFLLNQNNPSNSQTLKVGMDLRFPPFETIGRGNNPEGISVDVALALGEFLGREVEIVNTGFGSLIPALNIGDIDIIIASMSITPERAEVVDFSNPYFYFKVISLVNKGFADANGLTEDSTTEELLSLNNARFIGVASQISTTIPQSYGKVVSESMDLESAVLAIAQGKSDILVMSAFPVVNANKANPDTTMVNWDPFISSPIGMAVRKGETELLQRVNEFIAQMSDPGSTYDVLSAKYEVEVKSILGRYGLEFYING